MDTKAFMTVEDVAGDIGIDSASARALIRNLGERIERKGGIYIEGRIQAAFYQKMKESAFLSDDGADLDNRLLTEKRLLCLKEFCEYSGLGENTARKFAEKIGIKKRIGRKVLFDRELFDRWCDTNVQDEE